MNNMPALTRLDSPRVPTVVVAISYFLFIAATLARQGYDPSYFVAAGERFCDPDLVPKGLAVLSGAVGYDGQFYYRLALNPFTSKRTDFGVTIDVPPYRQQRLVYPLVVWALSFGRFDLVPVMMIFVNYIALCAMGWIGGLYAQVVKQHALWGLVLPLYPGFLMSLSLDLADILAVLFLLGSLLLIRQGRHLFAACVLTLAILTKETTLLLAVAALLLWLGGTWKGQNGAKLKWCFFPIPVVFYCLWQLVLLCRWGQVPLAAGIGNIGLPFSGFADFVLYTATLETHQGFQRLHLTELCFIAAFAISVAYSLHLTAACAHEKLSWLLFGILMSLLTRCVWSADMHFLRALAEFYVLGAIVVIGSQLRLVRIIRVPLFAWATVLWCLLFIVRMDFWR